MTAILVLVYTDLMFFTVYYGCEFFSSSFRWPLSNRFPQNCEWKKASLHFCMFYVSLKYSMKWTHRMANARGCWRPQRWQLPFRIVYNEVTYTDLWHCPMCGYSSLGPISASNRRDLITTWLRYFERTSHTETAPGSCFGHERSAKRRILPQTRSWSAISSIV